MERKTFPSLRKTNSWGPISVDNETLTQLTAVGVTLRTL